LYIGRPDNSYYTFGAGIPGLPGIQNINRNCSTLGCNVETTCNYLLDCFDDLTDSSLPFPISAHDPRAASASYQCLKSFFDARVTVEQEENMGHDEFNSMIFDPEGLALNRNLGPRVYSSRVLLDKVFGFQGPLWMTQTCEVDSGCPFVQGDIGGSSLVQQNSQFWSTYSRPGESFNDFVNSMRLGAINWQSKMGGQRPWTVSSGVTNVYMVLFILHF
jgi:hypothetical protein